jgi:asparagine synthase (glutamine-hydrolysing)
VRGRATQDGRGLPKILDELGMDWQTAYSLRFSGFTPGQRRYLQRSRDLVRTVWWRAADAAETQPTQQMLSIDFANTLPEYILRKGDLCTMAHGLELRAPMLDHVWLEKLFGVPDKDRFTWPAKQMLGIEMPKLAALEPFTRKKRGFNPPLKHWLRTDLSSRIPGLGARLQEITNGQLDAERVDSFAASYVGGDERLAEQLLQLLILDESLAQLHAINRSMEESAA